MKTFFYSLRGGELYPDQNGDVVVFVDGWNVKAFRKGEELEHLKFHLEPRDLRILNRIRELSRLTQQDVDVTPALAYPGDARRLMLSKLLGSLFEEFVFRVVSREFPAKRQVKTLESLHFLTGERFHNRPDIVVQERIALEVKVSEPDYRQLLEYSKRYPIGALVTPYAGAFKVPPRWRSFSNFLADQSPLLTWLRVVLLE